MLNEDRERMRQIVLAMWQQSAWRNGHRFVSNLIKENFKEDVFSLAQHVYKTFIDSNGDEKAKEKLLEELQLGPQPPPTPPTRGETRTETRVPTTEIPPNGPNLNTNPPPTPDGEQNALLNALLNAQQAPANVLLNTLPGAPAEFVAARNQSV